MSELSAILTEVQALHRDVASLREAVDDLGAMAARSVRLAEVVDAAEDLMGNLPDMVRKLADDPALGMMCGPTINGLADDLQKAIDDRRARRAGPPAIERA